jgi:hypothetical protein
MERLTRLPAAAGFGPDSGGGGLVTWATLLVVAGLAAWIVARETRRPLFAIAAAGLLLVGFARIQDDPLRASTLMLVFALAGLATLRFASGPRALAGAAVLLAAALLTGRLALIYGIAATCHLWIADRSRARTFSLAFAVSCAAVVLLRLPWLVARFGFVGPVLSPPNIHFIAGGAHEYVGRVVLGTFGLLSLPALLALAPAPPLGRRPEALWWWTTLAAVGTGLVATLGHGTRAQILVPTLAALVIVGPIAADRLVRSLPGGATRRAGLVFGAALALQILVLLQPARSFAPDSGDATAQRAGNVAHPASAGRR